MRKQNSLKEKLLRCAQKIAEREVINSISYWPPQCGGVIHQPKRPKDRSFLFYNGIDTKQQ